MKYPRHLTPSALNFDSHAELEHFLGREWNAAIRTGVSEVAGRLSARKFQRSRALEQQHTPYRPS